MSDFTGVEAVTSTLHDILLNRMAEPPSVTTAPPDVDVDDVEPPILNLFLYRVSESAGLRNQDLPGMAGPMSYGHPPLSLELHYLISATGLDPNDDTGAHRVLGDAMLVLHDHPLIAKDDPLLDPALQNEVELLKVTMEELDSEELSKVWTATTAPLRLSVGYKITVVQLESGLPRTVAKPVLEPPDAGPRVWAFPLDRPVIASVGVMRQPPEGDPVEQDAAYVRIGEQLVIRGTGFFPGTRVMLGDVDASASIDPISTSGRMLVGVNHPELQPGVHRVQLVRDVDVGEPPDERAFPFLRSNVSAFVLIPAVTAVTPDRGADGTTITIDGQRLFRDDAPSMVLIGDRAFWPSTGATPTQVEVTVSGLAAGTFPVSVRVNGAESIDPFEFQVT